MKRIFILPFLLAAPLFGQLTNPAADLDDVETSGLNIRNSIETSMTNIEAALETGAGARAVMTDETGTGVSVFNNAPDLILPVFQDSGDNTKEAVFVLSAIATGTQRTITMPNANVDLGNLTIGGEVSWAAIGDVADRTAFASGDKILIFEAGVGMRKIDFDDLPGAGGGLSNIVEDTTPQLGGQLDVNGNALGDGTLELLEFTETASAVNHVNITNGATGNGPIIGIGATGTETNVPITINAKGTGNITLGNFTFDADQTVGAGQDNYVFTYDNGSGTISLEAVAGGGLGTNLSSSTDDILSDNGTILFGGTGGTNNENLDWDFETTANGVGVSSSSGVTSVDFGTISVDAASFTDDGVAIPTISSTSTLTNKTISPASNTMPLNTISSRASPTVTNPYSLSASDCYGLILHYGATGEIDLPALADGMNILIYNTGAFTITIDPNGSEVIVRDGNVQTGGVSFTLSSGLGNYVALYSDGTNWITLGYKGTLSVGT